ncbi:proton-coupled amino acid transporter 4 [Hyalella azteca]|uniref:Proton-coupled amino acid transporter 4 n=3 Tax=Hyalella azteca TaxID=294128 RepID=A0A979FVY0_HYAAZ|nr:proton-coupled amino acid transporter 4 [Hyalella azteca]
MICTQGDNDKEDDNVVDGATTTRSVAPVGDERDLKHATSSFATFVHLLKGNIGPGILNMPEAFMHAGLYVGLIGIPVIGAICIHCMQLLLHSSKALCARTGASALSYEGTAEVAFSSSPFRAVRRQAGAVRATMAAFLVVTQLGFCCVYFVFVPQNLYQAIECMTGGTGISMLGYMIIMLVPVLLLCYIPELKHLTPISLTAGLLMTLGFIFTFYYLVRDLGSEGAVARPFFAGWMGLPLYFSSAIYAFEGIGLILPLENKMRCPREFGGAFGVLNTGMALVVVLFAAVGYFGYLQYGDLVQGSITLNLPPDETTVMLAALIPNICTVMLAALIPNIGLFINLVGAVSSSTLAIIFPPIVHLVTIWPETGRYNYIAVKAVALVAFGLLGFVTGSYASVVAIVNYLEHPHDPAPLVCS